MDFVYSFPVVRGLQAQKAYYIAMVPLKMIPRLFPKEDEYVLPEYRAQRRLNESRVPVIKKYILDNRDNYVFSAIAASIDGQFSFRSSATDSDIGVLEVSLDARFLINDGQHRKAAILEAIQEDESLGNETIPIVFFEDTGLSRSQQIFTDLNKNAVKTSNSISELYDSRDELAVLTRRVISEINFLNKYTDKEKDNLGKFSSNLFTLNTFYRSNKYIVGNQIGDSTNTYYFLEQYWSNITKNIKPWDMMDNGEITKKDLRENYIATQGIVIQAFGRVGGQLYKNNKILMDYSGLQKIDWHRSNKLWMMRAINQRGKIITNAKAILLVGNVIKQSLNIDLIDEEVEQERLLAIEKGDIYG